MLSQILLSFLPYAFVTAFTPGPNNILALNTVSNRGWRKGRPLILGICAGLLLVMVICALGCFELSKYLPQLTGILKYIGTAYIFWLAIHVARSKPGNDNQEQNESFWTGFILQFVNVKIILYGITVYTGYVLPVSESLGSLLVTGLCSSAIGISGTMTWALAGGMLQKYINKHYRVFNIAMALVLAWSGIQLLI